MFDEGSFRVITWMACLGFAGTFFGFLWLMYHLALAVWNYIF